MRTPFILLLLFNSCIQVASAQGCSDAGFCTMPHLGVSALNQDTMSRAKNVFKHDWALGIASGIGDDYNSISNPYFSYTYRLSDKFSLASKAVAGFISGDKGSLFALGDIYLSGVYRLDTGIDRQKNFLMGLKLPLNNSNLKYQGQALPLSYQTSLATWDAILGFEWNTKYVDLNAGAQIPLVQNNKNTFFAYADDTVHFASTHLFERKPDVLLRATYHRFSKNQQWKFLVGILGIYHLGEDTYVDTFSNRKLIKGSEGLTLNAVLAAHHYISARHYYTLSLGAPFVVREIRPDGLTRGFVFTLEYHGLF